MKPTEPAAKPTEAATKPAEPVTAKPAPPPPATAITTEPTRTEPPPPATTATATAPPPDATTTSAQPNPNPAAPDPVDDETRGRRRLYIGGMVVGGASALIGVGLWSKASSLGSDAKAAPNRSAQDIANLRDIESSGDHYALAGNVMFVAGLAVAGVSGYLYWRSGHSSAQVAPVALAHGGGITVSFEVP